MNRALILAVGTALCAVPLAASAQTAAPSAAPNASKTPVASDGHTDLSGFWSNATLTPERRPAKLGSRLNYTPEEAKKMESAVTKEVEEFNGTPARPLDRAALKDKFMTLTRARYGTGADGIFERLQGLETETELGWIGA